MKKNAKDQAPREGKRPFFARLLEEQELDQVGGGVAAQTEKFPSDSDECDRDPNPVTLKYPSDRDELSSS
ncbi:microviridin/marinostatin family tricyclic proteinase inhibitor [Archangium lansingense]|uniref:Microviridin/marinostatin family tricyclic proteinase inhibitor n=1 Tax=Archangium lansingense TaxID=2995310 RepID=A0ABT3ZZ74_9BACT|nr:microviridin/marinostatin family tricyclic proteinase inhibitor [Archangium lansinium]MCY1073987.1 microviridin/marinostatin family tricyclic proteinase inhibitor [Archangium lansinium]